MHAAVDFDLIVYVIQIFVITRNLYFISITNFSSIKHLDSCSEYYNFKVGPLETVVLRTNAGRNGGSSTHRYALAVFKHEASVPFACDMLDRIKLFAKQITVRPKQDTLQVSTFLFSCSHMRRAGSRSWYFIIVFYRYQSSLKYHRPLSSRQFQISAVVKALLYNCFMPKSDVVEDRISVNWVLFQSELSFYKVFRGY